MRISVVVSLGCALLIGLSTSVSRAQPVAAIQQDSLEVAMLKTTQTYEQVTRIMKVIPAQSAYLNLLPSVLPVDLPLIAFRVSSPFGIRRHPVHRQIRFHGGVDVKAATGSVVKATASGIVRQVGHDPALGVFVRIQHAFGFETTYGHLSGYCVKPGQAVSRNQEVGRVGQTGLATGPHLHYTIKKNGSVVDPFEFCFLLRHRLWLIQSDTPAACGISDSTASASLSEL
jgi:murein DD-endopeptidase MepM/ murein hydrolase activator NlpD